jgi:hypothetical protein
VTGFDHLGRKKERRNSPSDGLVVLRRLGLIDLDWYRTIHWNDPFCGHPDVSIGEEVYTFVILL